MIKDKIEQEVLKANIFDLIGLKNISQEKKQDLLEKMMDVVSSRISLRIANEFSADVKKDFDKLLDNNPSEEEVGKFLEEKVPNFADILAEEVSIFKQGLMRDIDKARKLMK